MTQVRKTLREGKAGSGDVAMVMVSVTCSSKRTASWPCRWHEEEMWEKADAKKLSEGARARSSVLVQRVPPELGLAKLHA